MIPNRIKPFFEITHQKKSGESGIIHGELACCEAHDFEVFVVGRIKYDMFSKVYLYPDDDKTLVEVHCSKCGKAISVFDSDCDGYGHCDNTQYIHVNTKPVRCKRCHEGIFSVDIKYEYPNIVELENLSIAEKDNAFTWIWITLKCNQCGTVYKNFVNCETD